jgi:DNA-binding XRE family transcriptional regulator
VVGTVRNLNCAGIPILRCLPHSLVIGLYLYIHLAELRERVQKTQVEMAQALGIKQPTVAGMEKPGRDLKLSSLKRYIEAAGGKLRLDVELPDGSHYGFVI